MDATSARVDQPAPDATLSAAIRWIGIGRTRRHTGEKLNGEAQKQFRRRVAVTHAIWGLALGAAVLHPLAVAICELYRLCGQAAGSRNVLDIAAAPFGTGMLHGAVAFALFGFVIGFLEGSFTGIVRSQRDELAQQLEINQAYRSELEARNSALSELEQENRRMTRFLVHDLKNHVGCVLGCAGLLLKRSRKHGWQSRDRETLTTVIRQAERMKGAVCDVLEQARLGCRPWIRLQTVQAIHVLHDALESAALAPGEGKVRIDPGAPGDLLLTCEPRLVVRVLANLVLNAVRHNEAGVEVTIGANRRDRQAVFFCADNGRGIPRSIRHRVFEEFSSETPVGELVPSYGLGLSFCRAAVEAQGGRIWFETAHSAGTTFFFSIPIVSDSNSRAGKTFKAVDRDRVVTMETSKWYTHIGASDSIG